MIPEGPPHDGSPLDGTSRLDVQTEGDHKTTTMLNDTIEKLNEKVQVNKRQMTKLVREFPVYRLHCFSIIASPRPQVALDAEERSWERGGALPPHLVLLTTALRGLFFFDVHKKVSADRI